MNRKISLNLSVGSVEAAITELKRLKEEIRFKNSIFVQKLAEAGLVVATDTERVSGDAPTVVYKDNGSVTRATLVLSGKGVAFVEFGAGVHYNGAGGSSPNPHGQRLGMTIGSYGKGQGLNDYWFYYDEEQDKVRKSYGTKATMPLAKADEAMRRRFYDIAKEVFG